MGRRGGDMMINIFGNEGAAADDKSVGAASASSCRAVINERTRVEEDLDGMASANLSTRWKTFLKRIRGIEHASDLAIQFLELNGSERWIDGTSPDRCNLQPGSVVVVESRQPNCTMSMEVPQRHCSLPDNTPPMQRMRGTMVLNNEGRRGPLEIIDEGDDNETIDTNLTSDSSSIFSFHSFASASTVPMGNGFQRDRSDVESVTSAWSAAQRTSIVALFDIPEDNEVEVMYFHEDDPWSAAKRGDVKALKLFGNIPSMDWSREDESLHTPLYYACSTGAAASKEGLQAVLYLLETWPDEMIPGVVLDECRRKAALDDVVRLLNGDAKILGRVRRQSMFISEEESSEYDGDDEMSEIVRSFSAIDGHSEQGSKQLEISSFVRYVPSNATDSTS